MRTLALLFGTTAVAALAGCASSNLAYTRPIARHTDTTKTIAKSRDAVWASAVPSLGKDFFVINNLDKASGLINVSYSGDPHDYVDCGHINAYFQNATGRHDYSFDGSAKEAVYTLYKYPVLVNFRRQMNLDGRINIIFETISANETRVTVNARYVMQRQLTARASNGRGDSNTSSIAFSSGGTATFPEMNTADGTECVPTGKLERDILSLIQ
ncbi:hypothetical protein WJ94_15895 [Burkholderia ubonensis]|uniref:hypothetical protein n=1 Tax=Burkholderia ubonensis TaxID=101571 RepID=UPI0007566A71|nr:hypothetical protein [Burkholderia ubonensis]KVP76893.1 hypothetical protein WJ94_15895 [Burkholderia ubonensis]